MCNIGHKLSEETKGKLSETAKKGYENGRINPMLGKYHRKSSKELMSITRKGLFREGKLKPRPLTIREKENIRKRMIEDNPMYNSETRKKVGQTKIRRGTSAGENNPAWRGGISFKPYGLAFNNQLKEQIRIRDNHQCQQCHILQSDSKQQLCVHHIDFNKQNNIPDNLMSLCRSCHGKLQFIKGGRNENQSREQTAGAEVAPCSLQAA